MSDTTLTKEHYHEMLDRLHVVSCMINDHLLEHPVAQQDEEIKKPIEEALDILAETYQIAGYKLLR
jgi:hypothetical protein